MNMNNSRNTKDNRNNRISIKELFITFSPILLVASILYWYHFPLTLSMIFIGLIFLTFVFMFIDQRRINGISDSNVVEVDEEILKEIHTRDIKEQIYLISKLDKLVKKNEFSNATDIRQELGLQVVGGSNQRDCRKLY